MIKLINILICILGATLLLAAPAFGDTLEADDPASQPVILVIGDSLSAAYNMQTREAWPSLLQSRLKEDGYNWRVFNSSITGDTTEGGLARFPRLLERYQPGIVIIELGGNDGLRGLPLEVTRANLEAMVVAAREIDAEVVLLGIRIPPNYGSEYVARFEGMYPELAAEHDAHLVDFFMQDVALVPGLMQADGVHPNVEAQPVLLDNVWPELQPLLD